jgi:uncharacterized protein (DUF2336 family)
MRDALTHDRAPPSGLQPAATSPAPAAVVPEITDPTPGSATMSAAAAIGDEAGRVRIAANPNAPARLLRSLATDASVKVRAALAMNPSTPVDTHETLAQDSDERIRALLGHRLAALLPSLAGQERETVEEHALAALRVLVTDEATRVRCAIADVLRNMAEAPRELILQLARDTSMDVAEQVIRLSPLLGTEDLLALVATCPSPETATAVARRPHLATTVADAIAASSNRTAITALLSNPTASIREMTLDALIARASGEVDWHEPLVRRPALSERCARALSLIVSTQLVGVLAERADIPTDLTAELKARLAAQLEPTNGRVVRAPSMEEAMAEAQEMARHHGIAEETVTESARRGEVRMCTAMIAVAADLPVFVVERACILRSAKGMVSLVWKAGFSMQLAQLLQVILVRLPPEAVMRPTDANGFPLSADEMRWQIQFLTRMWR